MCKLWNQCSGYIYGTESLKRWNLNMVELFIMFSVRLNGLFSHSMIVHNLTKNIHPQTIHKSKKLTKNYILLRWLCRSFRKALQWNIMFLYRLTYWHKMYGMANTYHIISMTEQQQHAFPILPTTSNFSAFTLNSLTSALLTMLFPAMEQMAKPRRIQATVAAVFIF